MEIFRFLIVYLLFCLQSISGLSMLVDTVDKYLGLFEQIQCCRPGANQAIPSFQYVLQHQHDMLSEETEFYDARYLLPSPKHSLNNLNQREFSATLIRQVKSVKEARRSIVSLSIADPTIPRYILRKIANIIPEEGEHCELISQNTFFRQQSADDTVISGYQFSLLFQKTENSKYAVIFSIFGVEFDCFDKEMHREYRKYKKRWRCKSDVSVDRRMSRLRKMFKSTESFSSSANNHEMTPFSGIEIYDQIDEIVDRGFEDHLKYDTMYKLRMMLSLYM